MNSADGRFEYVKKDGSEIPDGEPASEVEVLWFQCRRSSNPAIKCCVNVAGAEPSRTWQWDSNIDQPTLTPSINCHGCWHGYIRGGVFVDCGGNPEPKQ